MDNLPRGRRKGEAQHVEGTTRSDTVKAPEKPAQAVSAPTPVPTPKVEEIVKKEASKVASKVDMRTVLEVLLVLSVIAYGAYNYFYH